MKLYSLLSEERIRLNLAAATLEDAIEEILAPVGRLLEPVGVDKIKATLLERERNLSTSILEGVCLPHARIDGLQDFFLAIGVSPQGIPPADDSQGLIHLIFVILTPLTKNTLMLQTLAAVARLISSAQTRGVLLNVKTPARVLKIVEESGVDVKRTLCANDIMNPVDSFATPDMPLTRAMDLLVDSMDEGLPVLDAEGALQGELASSDIIALGLPKYMDLMENPALLRNVEPFEQFFQRERYLKVADLARKDVVVFKPDTPVVQIAHAMISEKRRRAYVVRDGKLVGTICRKDIVTKVLML
ncbi:MAG: PTS system fructose-specific EIIABC component [candidate division BRC1 bacterium ADurb.BinA364]|nr:MAG: PTS system fructose-specific EIIABC component [candidate division BRC1 bacterium ADurb.BinA364]